MGLLLGVFKLSIGSSSSNSISCSSSLSKSSSSSFFDRLDCCWRDFEILREVSVASKETSFSISVCFSFSNKSAKSISSSSSSSSLKSDKSSKLSTSLLKIIGPESVICSLISSSCFSIFFIFLETFLHIEFIFSFNPSDRSIFCIKTAIECK